MPNITIANDVIELHVVLNIDEIFSSFITKMVPFVMPTNIVPLNSQIPVDVYGFVDIYLMKVKSSRLRNSI